ncbi:MAG: serpin family protein [Prevotella sp.]|nr:serpin family protein [Prevotella sp.]
MKKNLLFVLTAALVSLPAVAQEEPKNIELTTEERQQVKQNNAFAMQLFDLARGTGDVVLSPLSVTYALGMQNIGAAGQTQQEILQALGFGEAGQDALNAFCQKLRTESAQLDKDTKVQTASTIFVNQGEGYELQSAFVEAANTYYDAQPQNRDFKDGETLALINQWASDHTEGMVKKVLSVDEFNEYAVSYLLNAIYFKGQWAAPFDEDDTAEAPFGANGKSVMMMHKEEVTRRYTENDSYQAISLPYGNGAYHMTVVLPREGKTISDVLPLLTDQSLPVQPAYEKWVLLGMPRFSISTEKDLKPLMQALGVERAFIPEVAEFPNFCNASTFISLIKQVARIDVDEKGTTAAAVTVIGSENSALPDIVEMTLNRPFLYFITEQSTGAIFFIGQYTGEDSVETTIATLPTEDARPDVVYDLQGRRLGSAGQHAPMAHGIYIQGGRKVLR